jgi:DNA-binding CsgD family transcriptional regulator
MSDVNVKPVKEVTAKPMWDVKIDPSIVLNSLPFICFWKDRDLNYLGCNPENLNAVKIKRMDEFIGKTDFDMPWKDVADKFSTQDKQALKGKTILCVETITVANGTKSSFLVKRAPLYAQNKKIIGVVGSGFDLNKDNYKEAAMLLTGAGIKIPLLYSYIGSENPDFIYETVKFTKRQAQIISHFLKGHSADLTAKYLGLSRRTIESAIMLLKEKLGCKEKYQIIDKALEYGFIDLMFRTI